MKAFWTLLIVLATATFHFTPASAENPEPRSKTVTSVLREPLPPEDLSYSVDGGKIVITGPTFEYSVDKTTGAVVALQVKREGQDVIGLTRARKHARRRLQPGGQAEPRRDHDHGPKCGEDRPQDERNVEIRPHEPTPICHTPS